MTVGSLVLEAVEEEKTGFVEGGPAGVEEPEGGGGAGGAVVVGVSTVAGRIGLVEPEGGVFLDEV